MYYQTLTNVKLVSLFHRVNVTNGNVTSLESVLACDDFGEMDIYRSWFNDLIKYASVLT
jgi:hypothetical protein